MSSPWDRLDGETGKAWLAFQEYLALGERRSISKVSDQLGVSTTRYLETWSARYDWVARAQAYDDERFRKELASRDRRIKRVRARALRLAEQALEEMALIARGELNGSEGGERDSDLYPVVSPATRLKALTQLMAIGGITIPKRMELSGPDGDPIEVHAQAEVKKLSIAQITRLLAEVGDDA